MTRKEERKEGRSRGGDQFQLRKIKAGDELSEDRDYEKEGWSLRGAPGLNFKLCLLLL